MNCQNTPLFETLGLNQVEFKKPKDQVGLAQLILKHGQDALNQALEGIYCQFDPQVGDFGCHYRVIQLLDYHQNFSLKNLIPDTQHKISKRQSELEKLQINLKTIETFYRNQITDKRKKISSLTMALKNERMTCLEETTLNKANRTRLLQKLSDKEKALSERKRLLKNGCESIREHKKDALCLSLLQEIQGLHSTLSKDKENKKKIQTLFKSKQTSLVKSDLFSSLRKEIKALEDQLIRKLNSEINEQCTDLHVNQAIAFLIHLYFLGRAVYKEPHVDLKSVFRLKKRHSIQPLKIDQLPFPKDALTSFCQILKMTLAKKSVHFIQKVAGPALFTERIKIIKLRHELPFYPSTKAVFSFAKKKKMPLFLRIREGKEKTFAINTLFIRSEGEIPKQVLPEKKPNQLAIVVEGYTRHSLNCLAGTFLTRFLKECSNEPHRFIEDCALIHPSYSDGSCDEKRLQDFHQIQKAENRYGKTNHSLCVISHVYADQVGCALNHEGLL